MLFRSRFANGDETDFRRSNIIILSRYIGVTATQNSSGIQNYKVYIHINGNFKIGTFSNEEIAGIAYNKAVDLVHNHGLIKNYNINYIESLSGKEYANLYTKIKLSKNFLDYLHTNYPITDSSLDL